MKLKFSRILGFFLIIFSWVIWGMILILPLFKLNLTQNAIILTGLLAGTNIFWVGAAMVGKDLIQKFNILAKLTRAERKNRINRKIRDKSTYA
jgi:hypothetical protein